MTHQKSKPLPISEKIELYITRFLRFTLVLAMIVGLFEQRWSLSAIILIILFLTFLPLLFERKTKINLPLDFELVIILLLYASLFLGEVGDYYARFWWWDLLLHGFSSVAVGFAGFLILYILYEKNRLEAKPIWICVFTFTFAVAAGALWEIFEFFMDQAFGTNMQKSGLLDTMWDMMVDGIGALITSFIGYFYLKGKRRGLFRRLMQRFAQENPNLFR